MSDRTRARAFLALCLARFRESYREPEVLFWAFVFPVLLSAALAVAFRDRPPEPSRARGPAGAGGGAAPRRPAGGAARRGRGGRARKRPRTRSAWGGRTSWSRLRPIPRPRSSTGSTPRGPRPASPGRGSTTPCSARRAARTPCAAARSPASEPGGRYVDFLVPGLIGMNLMSAGMWGVGYALVDMRIKKLLKRLLATPMRAADFMVAQMTMRVVSTFVEVGFLLGFAALALGVPVRGSLAAVMAVAVLGSMCFAGLGLAVGCRARKIETVSGLMNLVTMPMFVASGVFFSVERFPEAVQPAIRAAPPHRAQRRAAGGDAGRGRPRLPVAAAPACWPPGAGRASRWACASSAGAERLRGAGFAAGASRPGSSSAATTRFRPPSLAA